MRREPGLTAEDTLLSVTTVGFDIAGLELFLPLTTGACVVIAASDVVVDGWRLAQLLGDCGATVMQATPATWRLLLEAGWRGDSRLKAFCGGEALPRDLAQRLRSRCGTLWNLYGPTETTIWSAAHRVEWDQPIVIGRPIANTRFYVLDRRLQPVPVGVPGELLIGGDGLARGYLNRPELTAQRFIADPFLPSSGARLYRTGDQVRYQPDGCLEFVGRLDHQVKVRGHRVELGEIEATLGQHPQVRDQVVVVREDRSGEKGLVAYVVPHDQRAPEIGQLRAYLEGKLPAYMVPAVFVFLDALPLTAHGKVDHKALPDPGPASVTAFRGFTAPRNEAEEKLAALWANALGMERVGIHDNFFEFGGHSLMAVSLFNRIEAEFGRSIPPSTLFRAQTVARLAATLMDGAATDSEAPTVALVPGTSTRAPLFLVHTMSGDLLCWREMLKYLVMDNPVHGLKLPEKNGSPQAFPDITTTAAYHVERIRSVQPQGPYHLAGYSFGVTIALEIAQQLVAQGERVALLAVVDSGPTCRNLDPAFRLSAIYYFAVNVRRWIQRNLLESRPREAFRNLRRLIRAAARRLSLIPATLPPEYTVLGFESIEDLERLPEYYRRSIETNYQAEQNYVPHPYSGRVTLFRARDRDLLDVSGHDMGWRRIALDGVDVHVLPGDHSNILSDPNAQRLADRLRDCLMKAASST
jgi:thioesterase domain-containing protein/acyl carrier protein